MNYQKEKLRKQSHLQLHHKEKKSLGINLTKEVKSMYIEKCKTLMKESEEDTNSWKDILCSWIRRTNIV